MLIKSKLILNDITKEQNVGEITAKVQRDNEKEKYNYYFVFMLFSNNDNLTLLLCMI